MKEVEIRLSLAENVKSFVNIVSRFDYEMDLQPAAMWSTPSRSWAFSAWICPNRSSSSFTATTARIFSRP